MMDKHYDSDWAKAKSRNLVGDMLDKTILKSKKARDIKVLHFGGIDLAEVKQVYFPRGIRPENIVSLERDREIAAAQQRLNTGITVEPLELRTYLSQHTSLDFDVVSLDYTGPLLNDQLTDIERIARIQQKDEFILHTANLVSRDSPDRYVLGHAYKDLGESSQLLATATNPLGPNGIMAQFLHGYREIKNRITAGEDLRDKKGDSYTTILRTAYNWYDAKIIADYTRFMIGSEFAAELEYLGKEARRVESDLVLTEETLLKELDTRFGLSIYLQERGISYLWDKCKNKPPFNNELIFRVLANAIPHGIREHTAFLEKDRMRYSYTSESSSPMIGDVVFLARPIQKVKIAQKIVSELGYPYQLQVYPTRSLLELIKQYHIACDRFRSRETARRLESEPEERTYLGNASKPETIHLPTPSGYPANLLHRDIYRSMPAASKLRIDYFLEDRVMTLPDKKQNKIREAFMQSDLRKMMDPNIDPYRVFYFFDIVSNALLRKKPITPQFLNSTYEHVRDLPELVRIVPRTAPLIKKPTKKKEKEKKHAVSNSVKSELREFAKAGMNADELWAHFKNHFDSRRQFGAVLAWAHPSFDGMRKRSVEGVA